jgi:hypothetical protein
LMIGVHPVRGPHPRRATDTGLLAGLGSFTRLGTGLRR